MRTPDTISTLIIEQEHSDIARNRVIVDEYLVQWAGWAVEDQSWIPRANFEGVAQIEYFEQHNDPFRELPETSILPMAGFVHKDDMEKALNVGRKRKRRSSGGNSQSSGYSTRVLGTRLESAQVKYDVDRKFDGRGVQHNNASGSNYQAPTVEDAISLEE